MFETLLSEKVTKVFATKEETCTMKNVKMHHSGRVWLHHTLSIQFSHLASVVQKVIALSTR